MDKLIANFATLNSADAPRTSGKLYEFLQTNCNVQEKYYNYAVTHTLHPSKNYQSKFFEMAVVGDSFIQLVINQISFNQQKNKGQMNEVLKQFASNKYNSSQFVILCKKFNMSPSDLIKSYEMEISKAKLSEKMQESCFEGLIGAIYLSNQDQPMNEIIEYYNRFIRALS